jgi:hypothetical protein
MQSETVRTRQVFAVLRAAVDTDRDRAAARWIVRRAEHGGQILLARDDLAEDGTPTIDGERLADYAETLGKCADELAQEDPLRPPGRVLQAIEPPPGTTAPPANRLPDSDAWRRQRFARHRVGATLFLVGFRREWSLSSAHGSFRLNKPTRPAGYQ